MDRLRIRLTSSTIFRSFTSKDLFNLPLLDYHVVIDCRPLQSFEKNFITTSLHFHPSNHNDLDDEAIASLLLDVLKEQERTNPPDRVDSYVLYDEDGQSEFLERVIDIILNTSEFSLRYLYKLDKGFVDFQKKYPFLCGVPLNDLDFYPSEINDNLFLGSESNAGSESVLKDLKITHILNISIECRNKFENSENISVLYKKIEVVDDDRQSMDDCFHQAVEFIENAHKNNGIVLVHCYHGKSRSVAVTIAYLMKSEKRSFAQAFQKVVLCRSIASPNRGFVSQLQKLQNKEYESYTLPCEKPFYWKLIKEITINKINNFSDLEIILSYFHLTSKLERFRNRYKLKGLEISINWMTKNVLDFDFWNQILPSIIESALKLPDLFEKIDGKYCIPTLIQDKEKSVCLSYEQARCLLSNTFLCTLEPSLSSGDISFYKIFADTSKTGIERTKCLLSYFHSAYLYPSLFTSKTKDLKFERYVSTDYPDWLSFKEKKICNVTFSSTVAIEAVDSSNTFVDFANKYLHIHRVIPSATQEEVLFSIFPECFIGILISEVMNPNEAIYIRNVRRFCDYNGYGQTFTFNGSHKNLSENKTKDILAIDAIFNINGNEYSQDGLHRDLVKAYLGFNNSKNGINDQNNLISTGLWGCGVFGGDPVLKYCQQIIAASACNRTLHFSTFGQTAVEKSLKNIHNKIQEKNLSVSSLYKILDTYSQNPKKNFENYLVETLDRK
eukprot:c20132_g1_i1.p1 GENE.c20132_g1_i1~~c20132_g1_i1.p1  ORF type:complete len:733 (+),score=255.16 c20132_g1_i1:24-2201(+)